MSHLQPYRRGIRPVLPASFGTFVDQELDKVSRSLESHRQVIEEVEPWTYVTLPTTAATTDTAGLVTDLAFTPEPESSYLFEANLLLQTDTALTTAQPGLEWPTDTVDGAARVLGPSVGVSLTPSGGPPLPNENALSKIEGQLVTGPSPSGPLAVTIATDVAGSEARIMANSWLRYRTI